MRWGGRSWREHRRRGRGVGRRHDGAERDRGGPGNAGHEPARDQRHGRHGEPDRHQREAGDRAPVAPQVARRGVEGGVEQDRRHEQRERELGVERDLGQVRQQRQRRAGQRQQRGVGGVHPARQRGEHGAHQQERDDELEDEHGRPGPEYRGGLRKATQAAPRAKGDRIVGGSPLSVPDRDLIPPSSPPGGCILPVIHGTQPGHTTCPGEET